MKNKGKSLDNLDGQKLDTGNVKGGKNYRIHNVKEESAERTFGGDGGGAPQKGKSDFDSQEVTSDER